ncbi:MAG: trigger factor [Planctomycetota bacterium]|nr:trigger factor [Planctomycetota bacterium]
MKAEIIDIAPYRKRITIEIPREKVDEAFAEVYGHLQEVAQIRGFRRGHAPKRLLERRFAKEVCKDVCAKLVESSLADVIKENKIAVLAQPNIDLDKLEVKPGEAFGFTTELEVRPPFALPAYKGLKLTRTLPPPTEEDISDALRWLQDVFAEEEKIEGPAADEHWLEVDFQVTCEGKCLREAAGVYVAVNTAQLLGIKDPSISSHLRGAQAGEERVFSLVFPADYPTENFRGKTAEIKIKVNKVCKRQLPTLDDALAQRCGQRDFAALRALVTKRLESERILQTREARIEEIKDILLSGCSFELPPEMLQRLRETMAARLRWQLRQRGVSDQALAAQQAVIEQSASEIAERELRWALIIDAIADEENIQVTENDLQQHIERLAVQYETTPAQMWRQIRELNGVADVIATIREIKIVEFLLEQAVTPEAVAPPAEGGESKALPTETPARKEECQDATSS